MRHLSVTLAAAVSLSACASSTVNVPIADGSKEFRTVQKMDCRVYDQKKESLTIGFSFSLLWGAAAEAGPALTKATETGVKWDKSTQFIIAQYKELCSRYNAGAVSQPSYDNRIAEIDALYMEAQGIKQSADAVIRQHSKEAMAELDHETGGAQAQQAEQVASNVDALYAKTGAGQ